MKISILCSSKQHPIFNVLSEWVCGISEEIQTELVHEITELTGGSILFLISCGEIINESIRKMYNATLVIHASDLPKGRGWSPHVWSILEGEKELTVSLIEAKDKVDSGDIWKKTIISLKGHEIYDEINKKLFDAEIELMEYAISNYTKVIPVKQNEDEATYCRKREKKDSMLDVKKSIVEQFDLIRVCDSKRYPAFFKLYGHTYKITIEKIDN